jgi:hypothetical protein
LRTQVAPDLASIVADRDKLEKICLNLLFNAIKFTPAGGSVDLHASTDQNQLVIVVKDTGVGISPKNLPFVFDRFWQADNSSKRKFKGVGIGLSLVKELTEIQGGAATVQSEEGKGATFTIRLPYLKVDPTLPVLDGAADAVEAKTAGTNSEEWLTSLYRRAELFALAGAGAPGSAAAVNGDGRGGANGASPTVLIADDEPGIIRLFKSQIQER